MGELYPDIVDKNSDAYIRPEKKSIQKFNKKLWMNSGYALGYAVDNNPYSMHSDADAFTIGLLDFIYTSLIIIGPVVGDDTKSKIGFSLTGLFGCLAYKFWIGKTAGHSTINEYNDMIDTGYYLPKEMFEK